jgi:hypothetical protein|tara:strand:- start:121 stop:2412 length:2292 start_codon:yes stop_codon:yes gene_type:complete
MATNTAPSFTEHTAPSSGSTAGPYSISFSYIDEDEVDVTVDGVLKTKTTHYTFASATTIQFTSGNNPANSAAIKFQRDTNIGAKKVDFQDGSVLTETDLDSSTDQLLFGLQELSDDYVKRDGSQTVTGNLVFEGSADDNNETTLAVTNPTADRTITLPDTTGTVVTTGDSGTVTSTMINDGTIVNADINASAAIDGTKISPNFGSQNIVTSGTVDGRDVSTDGTKLDGIESGATADQTAAEIRTLVENATDSNVFTDADHTKLNGIEASATADQTAAEIRTLVGDATDSNVFTDAEKTKLSGIESGATQDQTGAEIKSAYEAESNTNAFTDTEKSKLAGIEASADVTDATNVNAAGAVMNSDLGTKGQILVGDGSGDPTALPVGTNNYVLVADSNEATGVKWATVPAGSGMSNLVEDTTPQLGGNLDINGQDLVTTSNGDIDLDPNGSGKVVFKGNSTKGAGQFKLNCEQNSHGIIIKGPPHSAAASYTLTLPNNDGDAGQFLKTDGSGNLSFDTVSLPDSDKIEEGNSKVEVVDSGTGYVTTEIDGTEVSRANASGSTIFTSAIFGANTNKADGTGQGISILYGGGTSNVGLISCTHTSGLRIQNNNAVQLTQNGSPNNVYASFSNTGGSFSTSGTARFDYDGTNINFALNILPDTDSNYDIGTSAKRFTNIYADNFYGSAANLTAIPAANITGTLPAIDGSNLTGITAGAQGGGGESIFFESEVAMDNDYTISSNHNALVAGPLTINATLTINSPSVVTIP